MSGSGNGNGNSNGDGFPVPEPTPLEQVTARIKATDEELANDPLYAWKRSPVGSPITTTQLHAGLISVSQIAEAAIDLGVHISSDLKQVVAVLPVFEQTVAQLRLLNEQVTEMQGTISATRREVQFLRDDVRELKERVELVPAIKRMLADVLTRLPEGT